MSKFRIVEVDGKFKVQHLEKRFFRKDKWVYFIKYYGSEDTFYFSSYQGAMKNLLFEIETETMRNSI